MSTVLDTPKSSRPKSTFTTQNLSNPPIVNLLDPNLEISNTSPLSSQDKNSKTMNTETLNVHPTFIMLL